MHRFTTAVLIIAVLATLEPGPPPLSAQAGFENVAVLVGGYQVFGQAVLADPDQPAAVSAMLAAPYGGERARAWAMTAAGGGFEIDFTTGGFAPRRPLRMQPGDVVTISVDDPSAGAQKRVLPVVALTAEADPATDTVSGIAAPGSRLSLTAYAADGARTSASVSADAEGRWAASLGNRLDLAPGTYGTVLLIEADGTIYQAAWAIPDLAVEIGATSTPIRARPGSVLRGLLTGADGLLRGSGTAVAWTGLANLRLRDAAGDGLPFLPGDRLEVSFESDPSDLNAAPAPIALSLPLLSARVEPDHDRVTGLAAAGSRVRVAVGPAGLLIREPTADAQGAWLADFAGSVDLAADTPVTVTLPDAPGVRMLAYAPMLVDVDPFAAAVRGRGAAGTPVALAVRSARGELRGQAAGRVGADGLFDLAVFPPVDCIVEGIGGRTSCVPGAPVDLESGDRLELVLGDQRQTVDFRPIDPAPDLSADSVSGLAWPGSLVRVTLGAEGPSQALRAGADGRWRADFAESADLGPGSEIRLEITAPEGFRTRFTFTAFRASAQTNGARVQIEGQPGLEAAVEIERGGRIVATGACTVRRTICEAPVNDPGGAPVRLAAGDLVLVVPEGAASASIAVFPMTAHIDVAGADVVGLAPPGDAVRIVFANDQGVATPFDTLAPTDNTGVYDHEFGVSEQSLLVPGLIADVFHTLSDGHQYHARAVVEVARLRPGLAELGGMAEPGAMVTAVLMRSTGGSGSGESLIAAGNGSAMSDGRFIIPLQDAGGRPVAPQAGDSLEWSFQRGPRMVERTIEVGVLAAWPLGVSRSVAGVATPGAVVQAIHHLWAVPGTPSLVTVSGSADPMGVFVLPEPPVDRAQVRSVEIVAYSTGGDELRSWVDLEAPPGRAWLPVGYAGR